MDETKDSARQHIEETPAADASTGSRVEFMREQIKQRPIDRQKLLRRTIITVVLAVVFGLIACLVFLLLVPVINNRLYPEAPAEVVSFPEEEEELPPEEMYVSDEEIATDTAAQIVQRTAIDQLMESYEFRAEDYARLQTAMMSVASGAMKSLVTVTSSADFSDWFDNPYEQTGADIGLIVADNGLETLILAPLSVIRNAERLSVTFADNSAYSAQVKMQDSLSGICILAVSNGDLTQATLDAFEIADLGSSNTGARTGTPVIAIGTPAGTQGSVCFGNITSESVLLDITDSAFRLLTTDIFAPSSAGGVLIDLNGRVVGLTDMTLSGGTNRLCAIGITELKPLISKLSNGEPRATLGIHGTVVPAAVREASSIPDGAYVTGIDMNAPAMNVGIQSGDIIIAADDVLFYDYTALCSHLLTRAPGETLRLRMLRFGGGEYREMTVDVTLVSSESS